MRWQWSHAVATYQNCEDPSCGHLIQVGDPIMCIQGVVRRDRVCCCIVFCGACAAKIEPSLQKYSGAEHVPETHGLS